MGRGLLIKVLVCVISFSFALCGYLNARNHVTKLMIQLPEIERELTFIEEKNTILQYEVDKFENPAYLLSLLKTKDYAHLVHAGDIELIAIEKHSIKPESKQMVDISPKAVLGTSL